MQRRRALMQRGTLPRNSPPVGRKGGIAGPTGREGERTPRETVSARLRRLCSKWGAPWGSALSDESRS